MFRETPARTELHETSHDLAGAAPGVIEQAAQATIVEIPNCLLADSWQGGDMDAIEVLVVEDEPVIYELLEDALSEAGFSVAYAANAGVAIAALDASDTDYAALVTDITLVRGGATGWDVARRARELKPFLPVVYTTGDAAGDWASHGVPNSVLITKPFAPMQVVTALSHLLNTTSGQGE